MNSAHPRSPSAVPARDIPAQTDPCVVAYHELAAAPSRDVYQLTPEAFAQHLQILLAAVTRSRRELRVTFDDAHRSQVELAAPALHHARLRGWFFAPAAWIGHRPGTAGWNELRHLVATGHVVGSHGHTHTLLTHCSPEALREELVRSRETLEDWLGSEVRTLSLPGGRFNTNVLRAAELAGYHELYTSVPSAGSTSSAASSATGKSLAVVGRLVVRRTTPFRTLTGYAMQSPWTMAMLAAEHRGKELLKGAVGDAAYQAAWRRLLRSPVEAVPLRGQSIDLRRQ